MTSYNHLEGVHDGCAAGGPAGILLIHARKPKALSMLSTRLEGMHAGGVAGGRAGKDSNSFLLFLSVRKMHKNAQNASYSALERVHDGCVAGGRAAKHIIFY